MSFVRGLVTLCWSWSLLPNPISEFELSTSNQIRITQRLGQAKTMVSRKKAKAREKRAAREAKVAEEKEEEEEESATVTNQDKIETMSFLELLTIDNLLRTTQCRHGIELVPHEEALCQAFLDTFNEGFRAKSRSGDRNIASLLFGGMRAIEAVDTFFDIWYDAVKLRKVISYCVELGVERILQGEGDQNYLEVSVWSSYVYFFEQHIALKLEKTQPFLNVHKLLDTSDVSDFHAKVSFFRKRINCSCLDKKYKELKPVARMAVCRNTECSLPERGVERKKILICSGCDQAIYCSRACQKVDWPHHKEFCRIMIEKKAEFDAKQRLQTEFDV